jgi:hypothetical protein
MILCQFIADSIVHKHLTIYGFKRNSTTLEKVFKLQNEHILIFCKDVNSFGVDKDSAMILYVDNDQILREGFVKYKTSKFCSFGYLKKMKNQLHDFKTSKLSFTMKDLTVLLSNDNEESFVESFHILINDKINKIKTQANDYRKLYTYWRNNCYSNEDHYKNQIGDRYIDIKINYELIKKDKKVLHTELKKMFKLFNKNIE